MTNGRPLIVVGVGVGVGMQSRCAAVGSPTRRAHRDYLAEAPNGTSLPGPARRPRRAARHLRGCRRRPHRPTHTAVVLVARADRVSLAEAARAADELAALGIISSSWSTRSSPIRCPAMPSPSPTHKRSVGRSPRSARTARRDPDQPACSPRQRPDRHRGAARADQPRRHPRRTAAGGISATSSTPSPPVPRAPSWSSARAASGRPPSPPTSPRAGRTRAAGAPVHHRPRRPAPAAHRPACLTIKC